MLLTAVAVSAPSHIFFRFPLEPCANITSLPARGFGTEFVFFVILFLCVISRPPAVPSASGEERVHGRGLPLRALGPPPLLHRLRKDHGIGRSRPRGG